MARTERQETYAKRLDSLRDRLLEDPGVDELNRMKVQMDMLERALGSDLDFHHHDTNEHHDHVTLQDQQMFDPQQQTRTLEQRVQAIEARTKQ